MVFPYWEVQRGDQTRRLPLVPLRLHSQRASLDVLALVDSGAEHSVFGSSLAERLRIPLQRGTPVTIVGVSGVPAPGRLTTVRLQLGKHTWHAPAIFSSAANERAILGQAWFFAFFTVTFHYSRGTVDIRRSH